MERKWMQNNFTLYLLVWELDQIKKLQAKFNMHLIMCIGLVNYILH